MDQVSEGSGRAQAAACRAWACCWGGLPDRLVMVSAGPLQLRLGLLGAGPAGASVTRGSDLGFQAPRSPGWSRVASCRACRHAVSRAWPMSAW